MYRTSLPSTAALVGSHDANRLPATNGKAPVTPRQGAAVEGARADHETGAVASGAGIAGMAGPAGPARPESLPVDDAADAPPNATTGMPPVGQMQGSDGPRSESHRACVAATRPVDDAADAPPAACRTVLHVDIDAFFASIEQQRDPRLKGKPVIVGAGVIASCSYEARRFGLKAGMSLTEARRLCPKAVVLEGHAQVYRCFAERIFEHCRALSPDVETYLDEAYLELTGTDRAHGGDLMAAAARLRRAITDDTGLTVTCGLGPNRMLAKLAGKTVKPDGLARVLAHEAEDFLTARPIEQLAGVGHAHAKTLRSMNLRTIGDLRALPVAALEALFGAPGRLLYERCRGRDTAPVTAREIPLTISRETSFHRDTADPTEIEGMLDYLTGRACRAAREIDLAARTVAVRLRYSDGEGAECARTLGAASAVDPVVFALALELLRRQFTRRVSLHAVGVTLSHFTRDTAEQGALFDEREAGRRAALCAALDRVRGSFGHGSVVSGRALHLKDHVDQDRHGFRLRTPSLTK